MSAPLDFTRLDSFRSFMGVNAAGHLRCCSYCGDAHQLTQAAKLAGREVSHGICHDHARQQVAKAKARAAVWQQVGRGRFVA